VNGLIIIVILAALFWLLLIRPQRRRQSAQNELIAGVEVGDEIVTAGGLYGHVVGIGDDELLVEIAHGVNVRIARRAVAGIVGPDEEEDEEAELEEPAEAPEAPGAAHEAATDETPR
jgi:preprotein translocase subunit YajC